MDTSYFFFKLKKKEKNNFHYLRRPITCTNHLQWKHWVKQPSISKSIANQKLIIVKRKKALHTSSLRYHILPLG